MRAFYVFAGYVATRAALTSHVIDRALAAISATKPTRAETAQSLWLLGAANVILAGGAALVLLLEAAAWIFVASALAQAAYLFFVAPRFFERDDPPDATGRRQSTNAFVVYAAATALVLWAAARGKLAPWQDVPWPIWRSPPRPQPCMSSTRSGFSPSRLRHIRAIGAREARVPSAAPRRSAVMKSMVPPPRIERGTSRSTI